MFMLILVSGFISH